MPSFSAFVWLAALLLTLVLAIRAAVPRGHRRRVRPAVLMRALLPARMLRSASGRLDIAAFLFSLLLAGSALGWALVSADWWARQVGRLVGGAGPGVPGAALILTVALFLAYEASYWLNHWLSHRIGWLWQFHKVHHTAESLSLLTNFRVHPVDTILFYNMAAAIMGVTAGLLRPLLGDAAALSIGGTNLLVFVGSIVLSYLQHSQLWIAAPGRWGRVVLSPAHHQLHHSVDPEHHHRNFGGTLAVFDWAFGTLLRPTTARVPLRFGVTGLGYDPHGFRGAVLMPFVDAAHAVLPGAFGAGRSQGVRAEVTAPPPDGIAV